MGETDQDVTTDVTDHDPWFALAEFRLRMIPLLADDDQLAGLDVRNVLGGAVRPADRRSAVAAAPRPKRRRRSLAE